jgi:hypothetical protein
MSAPTNSGGIGVFGALGVLFVGLKLGGVIDWSWWWVTAPFWGPLALLAAVLAGIAAIALIAEVRR